MIDEPTFQAALDAEPTDHALRLVFADWLEEAGDWRAEGYRWMGSNQKCPMAWGVGGYRDREYPSEQINTWTWGATADSLITNPTASVSAAAERAAVGEKLIDLMGGGNWVDRLTRRLAEEALCRAVAAAAR